MAEDITDPAAVTELRPGSQIRVSGQVCNIRSVGITGATAYCARLGEFEVAKWWPTKTIIKL